MQLTEFQQLPLLGILRGIKKTHLPPLLDAIMASGLRTLEITMNTPQAAELLALAKAIAGNRLVLGAGTVLNLHDLRQAVDNGATFIVMPTLVDEVASYCSENSIPFFPGALTPQEIYTAWQTEPAMVKIFPAKCFGPDYFREIKGPFNHLRLLACGGVTPENLPAYAQAGADAFGLGGSVFKPEWLEAGDFGKITDLIRRYLSAWKNSKPHLA